MKKLTPLSSVGIALILVVPGISPRAQENPVLPTTTVSSSPQQTYIPRGRVTANEYFQMLQTTGSYGVNRERSLADQTAAISRAREMKRLKKEISRVRHYRSNFESSSDFLQSIPPPPEPEPLEQGDEEQDPASAGTADPPTATSSPAPDVPTFVPVSETRVPLFEKLKRKRRQGDATPEFATPNQNSATGPNETLPPPASRQGPDQINAPEPPSTPPVPRFAGREDAPPAPPQKKGLFSLFRKNSGPADSPSYSPTPETNSAVNRGAPTVATTIFRPGSTVANPGQSYVITGRKVFADLGDKQVKLSPGTRVTLVTTGTSRSLIRLSDNRQGTVPNEALSPGR